MWYIAVIGVVGVGGLLLAVWMTRGFRKRIQSDDAPAGAFSLEDLRKLLNTGQITREEFETMRATLIKRVQTRPISPPTEAKPPVSTDRQESDEREDSGDMSK